MREGTSERRLEVELAGQVQQAGGEKWEPAEQPRTLLCARQTPGLMLNQSRLDYVQSLSLTPVVHTVPLTVIVKS